MARCLLYANEVLLGWADLVPTDPSMGGVSGAFHPTENYRAIQATIWNAVAHSDYGKYHTPAGVAAYAAKDALGLRVCTETKEPLEQVGPIWLDDFTDQLLTSEIVLDVVGVPWWVLERVFGWNSSDGI